MVDFNLANSRFELMSIKSAAKSKVNFRGEGVLRNLDGSNSVVVATGPTGSGAVDAILADATTAADNKAVIQAGQDLPIQNIREVFMKAIGGDVLVQWIPVRTFTKQA